MKLFILVAALSLISFLASSASAHDCYRVGNTEASLKEDEGTFRCIIEDTTAKDTVYSLKEYQGIKYALVKKDLNGEKTRKSGLLFTLTNGSKDRDDDHGKCYSFTKTCTTAEKCVVRYCFSRPFGKQDSSTVINEEWGYAKKE